MKYISHFRDFSQADVSLLGGKGAVLAELTKEGFPIPQGFIITTTAFQDFHNKKLSQDFIEEIYTAFTELNTERVAVRSSAIGEDSSTASWAGQLKSYLNIDKKNLLEAIKKCWRSVLSKRAISYAQQNNIPTSQLAVAVVIQKMVTSEAAGVMFTVNPVSNNPNEVMIEACLGLGELLVQGEITPDNYIVDKKTLKITTRSRGSQEIMLAYQNGKNQRLPTPQRLKDKQILTDKQIALLAELGGNVETHYKSPQDIEWALEKGKISIVQSRPITTLTQIKQPITWQKLWTRQYGIHFISAAILGLSQNQKLLLKPITNILSIPEPGGQGFYVDQAEYNLLAETLNDYYINKPSNLQAFNHDFLQSGKNYVKKSIRYANGIVALKNDELLGRLRSFINDFNEYNVYTWITFFLNDLMSEKIVQSIDLLPVTKTRKKALLDYALQPSALSSILLLNHDAQTKDVKTLAKNFRWITTLDIQNDPATQHDIKDRLTLQAAKKFNKPTFFSDLDTDMQKLILLSKVTTYNKDVRDDFRRQAMLEILPLFDEIGKRLSIDRKALSYLTKLELEEAFLDENKKELIRKSLQRQNEGFMLQLKDSDVVVVDGLKKIKMTVKQLGLHIPVTGIINVKEIKGIIGFRGKVTGKVKIVRTVKDLNKIHTNDVLCAVTTNPDYLPGMKKAIAFITDEGGITCHAAIVAREMNKPCIVGTKIATHILKDGDLVEVNAIKGVIHVLK